ncbi:MAG: hypothetical protein AVDCRST_MAG01-01-4451 [uncultured Rubrobacteraceae bacterium]|uniref:Uncharacterized protein n=1 Tax=uncultured Rubrobacteraceae bacterium TaxID=349277 RepID=A0A6J4QWG0_9ACTN|nr:MAG: hypothetical protein AVDCRST_MAG01-01-4451 [uncultured Rubrobacteraceae bacterium]
MVRVWPARKPSEVYPSSIGSWAVARDSIWKKWSITVKSEAPPSSAARAVAAKVGASDPGPPGSVKFAKCIPSFMQTAFRFPGDPPAAR